MFPEWASSLSLQWLVSRWLVYVWKYVRNKMNGDRFFWKCFYSLCHRFYAWKKLKSHLSSQLCRPGNQFYLCIYCSCWLFNVHLMSCGAWRAVLVCWTLQLFIGAELVRFAVQNHHFKCYWIASICWWADWVLTNFNATEICFYKFITLVIFWMADMMGSITCSSRPCLSDSGVDEPRTSLRLTSCFWITPYKNVGLLGQLGAVSAWGCFLSTAPRFLGEWWIKPISALSAVFCLLSGAEEPVCFLCLQYML